MDFQNLPMVRFPFLNVIIMASHHYNKCIIYLILFNNLSYLSYFINLGPDAFLFNNCRAIIVSNLTTPDVLDESELISDEVPLPIKDTNIGNPIQSSVI